MKTCTCDACLLLPEDERDLVTDVGITLTKEQVQAFIKLLERRLELGLVKIVGPVLNDAT